MFFRQVQVEEQKKKASREWKVRARAGGGGETAGKNRWGGVMDARRRKKEKESENGRKYLINQRGETGILHGQG